jgi:putative molybdopterin biosynthesis protein
MTNELSYTTEEISKILRISKLTVYDLIKKGELTAYRVGRQMRVDAGDLEQYKLRAKSNNNRAHITPNETIQASSDIKTLIITGQDVSLDILSKHIEKHTKAFRPLRSYVGSLDSLISLYQGQADIVSTHLLDGDTGEYNIPYIQKLLVGFPYIIINLVARAAGLYVQKGNPKEIHDWGDLNRADVRMVNREKGSGARILLDEQLRLRGISSNEVHGYTNEESNHLGVAGKVATGEANVGVGIEKAAYLVGVDFIPLIQERYDLVMIKSPQASEWIELVKSILSSDAFQNELKSIQGYDLTLTGKVLLETK